MDMLARAVPILVLACATGCFPFVTEAAGLININTATASTLETLPGIGATYAERIIEYRAANGPFATTEAVENVSGIGPATFAKIEALITVGDPATNASLVSTTTASSSTPQVSVGDASSTYVPPPSALTIAIDGSESATLNVPATFRATVSNAQGGEDTLATVLWGFGDGSASEGRSVTKTFQYPGTYLVEARAEDGEASAVADIEVTVEAAQVHIAGVSGAGVELVNAASAREDLSGWRLAEGGASFRFPAGTVLLAGSAVRIPQAVTNLPIAVSATLLYPDGAIAAQYPLPEAVVSEATSTKLSASSTRSSRVQTVGSVVTNKSGYQQSAYEGEAVNAPRESGVPTLSRGAAVSSSSASSSLFEAGPIAAPATLGMLHSGWLIGFLGVLALAGGAVMIL